MQTDHSKQNGWRTFLPAFFVLCLLPACRHAPETAEELQRSLPPQYRGELHLQGETDPHRLVVEPHGLSARDTHVLEFKQVRYQFFTGNNVAAEGEANIRGTISTPDLTIRIEDFGGEGGGDALKPGTFEGKLSKDLRTMDANWTTGFGQKVTLKAKSE